MKIKSMTAVFGKLDRATLEPGPGLNLIHAPNEGGKSTWAAFWRAMLYGVDTRDRDKKGYLADKNRWQPWSGAPMEGELDLEWEGREITVYRGPRGNVPFGSFSAVCAGTGESVPGLTADNCGELLTGVGRPVFERSAFLGGNLSVTPTPELEKRIAALVSSGQEDVSFSQAQDRLRDWLNRRRVNRSVGLLPRLEEELRRAREALDGLEEVTGRLAGLEERRNELEREKRDLEWEQHVHRRLAQRKLNDRYAQAGRELEEAQAQLAALEKEAAKYGPIPAQEELKRAQGELQYIKVLEDDVRQGEAALGEAETAAETARAAAQDDRFPGLTGEEAVRAAGKARTQAEELSAQALRAERRRPLALLPGLLLGLALTAAGWLLWGTLFPYLWCGMGLFGAMTILLSNLWNGRIKKLRARYGALLAPYGADAPGELTALAEDYAGRRRAAREAEGQAQTIQNALNDSRNRREASQEEVLAFVHTFAPQATNLFGCSAAISRALSLDHELSAARERVRERQKRRDDLAAQGGREWDTLEMLHPPERSPEETDTALALTVQNLDRAREELNRARGLQQAMGDPAALWARQEELTREVSRRRREYDALTLALAVLEEANASLRERFSPELNRLSGAYLSRLTGARWSGLTLNRELEGSAARAEDVLPRSALTLSRGTADQLYLAVRLAVCRLCLPSKPPIVLDDALLSFDDERLRLALDLLRELAGEQQILLFTCQRREDAALAGVPGVTFLEL